MGRGVEEQITSERKEASVEKGKKSGATILFRDMQTKRNHTGRRSLLRGSITSFDHALSET